MTGLSQVNFDVQGLGDDEEAQLDKEDAEREQELHQLLSKELPDELLEDESFTSPGLGASTQGCETPEFDTDQPYEQPYMEEMQDNEEGRESQHKQPEYPQLNRFSMLLTRRGEEFIQRFATSPSANGAYHPEPSGSHTNPSSESVPRGYHQGSYGYMEDRDGYSEADDRQYTYHVGDDPMSGESDGFYEDSDYGDGGDGYSGGDGVHDQNFNVVYSKAGAVSKPEQAATSNTSDIIDDFKVQYKRGTTLDVTESQHEAIQHQVMLGQTSVSPSTVELAQLQILHRARKRKLEELTNELASKEKDYERKLRVLNHQLALVKGERDGMASSLEHAQEIATSRKNEVDELERKLQDSDLEKERMNGVRNEIESELESAKKTIESLHHQLMELEKSESLSRAREQHENVVMATKKRHNEDIARLKQKLDDVNNSLMWKDEESKRLHDELVQARKEADRARLERAETVNRLTKSLEQSQKQNEELLNSGSTQEISQLQRQLSLTQHEKENVEEMYKTMEADLVDLKEQLRIYESMSKLGARIEDHNDGVKRNLEADEWRTPTQGTTLQSTFSTQEALVELQKELQHSLTSNRTKREEIQQLRSQVEEVQKHLVGKENEIKRFEILVKKQEMRVLEQEKKISELEELNRNPEMKEIQRKDEKNKLHGLIKEQDSKLEQCSKRAQELEQLNLQLKSQMSEMVRDHDADKQKSVEQCRQSCLEFHDQAVATMKQQLISEYDDELAKLRRELEAVTTELHQAKESYVVLSEESRWIEKQTRERCEEEANERMKESQMSWNEAKSCELLKLRQTLTTEMERSVEKEKAIWREEEEQRLKSKVETELALAKMDWSKDQQKLRKEAVEYAVNMVEKEWLAKYGKESHQEELDEKVNDLKMEWEQVKRQELDQRLEEIRTQMTQEQDEKLNKAHQEFERLKENEIKREIERARLNWDEELATIVEQAKQTAVANAKNQWLKEQKDGMSKAREEDLAKALTSAKQEWEKERDLQMANILASEKEKWQTAVFDETQQATEKAVSLAEERWNKEHINKVNSAVKEALELAEATWKKEKDSAIESAVTQSLHSAKETWNENKIKEIEQILSNARKQWLTELNFNKQESTTSPRSRRSPGSSENVDKTFSYLEAQYSKNLKEFRETELKRVAEEYDRNILDTIDELEKKFEVKLREQEDKYLAQLDSVARKSQEEREVELKELETEYQSKLEGIVEEIEEKWREKKATLEEDWAEKFEKQREDLQTSYRDKYQKERESLGRQMREKYEKGVEHARKKLEYQFKEKLQGALERAKYEWEAEQEEDRLAVEEQHVKKLENERERLRNELQQEKEQRISQVENESSQKTRKLEEQLKNEKDRYKMDIESLQKELQDIKLHRSQKKNGETEKEQKLAIDDNCKASQTDSMHDQPWVSLTEISHDTPNYEKLDELRRQYLETTAQLKEDLMQHAIETRNNAAKAIRSEVMKERHSTANQLRKYYLECLKQILDEDKEAYKNNQPTKSNEDKLKIMEERLRLPAQKNESMKSYNSTLTNVTALPDTTGELNQTSDENAFNTIRPNKDSARQPRDHKMPKTRPPSGRTERTKHQNDDRGEKHGETNHPRLQSTRRQNSERFRMDFESNSRGMSSSTESFDSLLSPQTALPPVIELLGQASSDSMAHDQGFESNSSDSSGRYERQEYVKNERIHHRTERDKNCNQQGTRQNIRDTSQRVTQSRKQEKTRSMDTNSNKRDTYSHQHSTHENACKTISKQEDARSPWRRTHSSERENECSGLMRLDKVDTHSQKLSTHENIQGTHLPRETRSHDTQISAQSNQVTAKTLSHPVIKSGNSLKITSSLRRPVGDVLPSKPLSPGKFSYSMHTHKTNK